MEKRFNLATQGKHLWTRELGKQVRGQVEALLLECRPGETVVVDAAGVEVFDFSFASEFFGKLVLSLPHEYQGKFLLVEGLTAYARENLQKALEDLGLVLVERKGRKLELMGKVHPADRETFATMVRSKGRVSAGDLSSELGVNLTAMNERLAKLVGLGLVARDKGASAAGREQFLYWTAS